MEVSTKLQSCDPSAVLKLVLSQSNPPNVTSEGDLNTPYYCLATAATPSGPFDTHQGQLHIMHVFVSLYRLLGYLWYRIHNKLLTFEVKHTQDIYSQVQYRQN